MESGASPVPAVPTQLWSLHCRYCFHSSYKPCHFQLADFSIQILLPIRLYEGRPHAESQPRMQSPAQNSLKEWGWEGKLAMGGVRKYLCCCRGALDGEEDAAKRLKGERKVKFDLASYSTPAVPLGLLKSKTVLPRKKP